MTNVSIKKKNNSIHEIVCDGHTNYGVKGEDIVCASLSSIVQTTALGLLAVVGINVSIERDDRRGFMKIVLPDNLSAEQQLKADVLTSTLLLGISDLHEGYSDFIELEVK